jgi:hypothetical protein
LNTQNNLLTIKDEPLLVQQSQFNKTNSKSSTHKQKKTNSNNSSSLNNKMNIQNKIAKEQAMNQQAYMSVGSISPSDSYQSEISNHNMNDSRVDNKLEKKRERNREAARKCRTRKLEKIARLEIQVKKLTEENELERAKTQALKDDILRIKMKLEEHQKASTTCDLKINL